VELIDLYLEKMLDLGGAGKYAELARGSVAEGLAGEESAASWKAAAYDVWLRIGLVSFCQGKGKVAAEAFGEAKELTSSRFISDCLDALIASAGKRRSSPAAGSSPTASTP